MIKKRIITKDFMKMFTNLEIEEIGRYNTYIDLDIWALDDLFAWYLGISVKDFQEALEKDCNWFNAFLTYKPRTKDKKVLLFINDRDLNIDDTIELVGCGKELLLKQINKLLKN